MNNVALAGFLKKQIQKYEGGADLESNKSVSITTNGTTVVQPSTGKDGMERVTVTTAVPLPVHETNKTATIDVSEYVSPVEITPSANKDVMDKATVTLAGIPVLESNKTATIDVSQYSEPIEITPSANKDAMEKTTITLENIPSGGSGDLATLYCWSSSGGYVVYTTSPTPSVDDTVIICSGEGGIPCPPTMDYKVVTYEDDAITIDEPSLDDVTFDRYSEGDIPLSPSPSGGTATAYAWKVVNSEYPEEFTYSYLSADISPTDRTEASTTKMLMGDIITGSGSIGTLIMDDYAYTRVSETEFEISWERDETTITLAYTRDSTKDFTLWQISE
ncbi:hypothetical protein SAMN04487977_101474 [Treponema bryantii]|uniref:Uncharacterized protein n=1 Tax=Treponema bryantii TaxID=163 RepID=A0A1H9AVD2_9SPIR|nr:hypothetical protein [Treponema bryantii]SEP80373.1 hypothetical protein SAMN04487977_101474 [Treponema bryantii]